MSKGIWVCIFHMGGGGGECWGINEFGCVYSIWGEVLVNKGIWVCVFNMGGKCWWIKEFIQNTEDAGQSGCFP